LSLNAIAIFSHEAAFDDFRRRLIRRLRFFRDISLARWLFRDATILAIAASRRHMIIRAFSRLLSFRYIFFSLSHFAPLLPVIRHFIDFIFIDAFAPFAIPDDCFFRYSLLALMADMPAFIPYCRCADFVDIFDDRPRHFR